MNEQNLNRIGLAAVDEFIAAFNARDPVRWAASLNYPHVRPSQGQLPEIIPDAATYAAGVNHEQVVATGWDHSEWDYRRVLHISPRKIHVAGQWSRYNSEAKVILTRPIVYVVTEVDGHWGIQARLATDGVADDGAENTEREAFKVIQSFVSNYNSHNMTTCAGLLNYPHIEVEVGALNRMDGSGDFSMRGEMMMQLNALVAIQTGHRAINVALEVTLFDDLGLQHPYRAAILLTRETGPLAITAWSFIAD